MPMFQDGLYEKTGWTAKWARVYPVIAALERTIPGLPDRTADGRELVDPREPVLLPSEVALLPAEGAIYRVRLPPVDWTGKIFREPLDLAKAGIAAPSLPGTELSARPARGSVAQERSARIVRGRKIREVLCFSHVDTEVWPVDADFTDCIPHSFLWGLHPGMYAEFRKHFLMSERKMDLDAALVWLFEKRVTDEGARTRAVGAVAFVAQIYGQNTHPKHRRKGCSHWGGGTSPTTLYRS